MWPGTFFSSECRDKIFKWKFILIYVGPVSYTHLRAHETSLHLVCRLLLEKKKEPIFTLTPALVYADTKSALKLSIVYLSAADKAEELIRNTEYPHR